MAFVKEQRLAALSEILYITSTFDDTGDTWASLDLKFPDTIYNITQSAGWRIEETFAFHTFDFIGRNTDDDSYINESDTIWEDLTSYYWSKDASANILQTLDGNWEDKTQLDKAETDLGSYFKLSWGGLNSTWDSLT